MTRTGGRRIPELVLAGFVLAAAIALIGWRLWTPIDGARRAFGWDAPRQYWGDLVFQIQAVRHGELPLWNPYDRCGYPFAPDPQAGVLYPVNWLLVATGLLVGAKFWLVTAKTLFHLWWLSFGVFVWLRRRGMPEPLCYAAGIFCVLAYPVDVWFMAINWSFAWLPWILIAIDAWAEAPSRKTAAWLALAVAMCELAGSPPGFWYVLLVAVPYVAWLLATRVRGAARSAYARTGMLALALIALMLVGPFAALATLFPHTVRAERDLAFITNGGVTTDELLGLVVPRMPEQTLYAGTLVVLAAGVVLTLRPTSRSYFLAALAAAGVLLATRAGGGLLASFASVVAPAAWFRVPQRYLYVALVPLAALGAEGIAALATLDSETLRERAARWIAIAGAAGSIVAAVAIVRTPHGDLRDAYVYALLSWVIAAWLLRRIATTGRLVALAAVVLALDMWFAHAPAIEVALWEPPATAHDAEARTLPGVPLDARIFDRMHFEYRAGTRLEIRDLGGYEADPLALDRYAKLLGRVYENPHVLGHANVAYVAGTVSLDQREMTLGNDFAVIAPQLFRVPDVAPAVAWYPATRVVADQEAAMAALPATRPGTLAIVEEASADPRALALPPSSASPIAGRIVALRRNTLAAEIDAPAAGVVVIAEMVHPGWRATVDGATASIFPANGAFRGLFVEAGHHRIEMKFHAGLAGWLMLLSPLGLALALAATRRTL